MDNEIEQFKKDFGILEDLSDIKFSQITKENYRDAEQGNAFGEKLCTIYTLNFSIFNVIFSMKILVFIYERSSEVLKQDIGIQDVLLEKEIAGCRNYLQRYRNINSTFFTLKKIARCYESRRLIIDIILNRAPRIRVRRNEEQGILFINYHNPYTNITIELGWKIDWNVKSLDIVDDIEIYYNRFEVPNAKDIKDGLKAIAHSTLDFNTKFRLWKQLISDLSKYDRHIENKVIISDSEQGDNVLVISDSDDDSNDTNHNRKRRKLHSVSSSSTKIVNVAD